MPITATDSGGGSFELIPPGTYESRCYRLIDLGSQTTNWQGEAKTQRKILVCWEIPSVEVEIDGEMKPGIIMSRYTLSIHSKSNLGRALESWRGKSFTDAERAGFDIESVVGAPCMINVTHGDDGRFANVAAVMAMPRGNKGPAPVNPKVIFSLETPDWGVFGELSEKIQAIIKASPEYQALQNPQAAAPAQVDPDFDDDLSDIPF